MLFDRNGKKNAFEKKFHKDNSHILSFSHLSLASFFFLLDLHFICLFLSLELKEEKKKERKKKNSSLMCRTALSTASLVGLWQGDIVADGGCETLYSHWRRLPDKTYIFFLKMRSPSLLMELQFTGQMRRIGAFYFSTAFFLLQYTNFNIPFLCYVERKQNSKFILSSSCHIHKTHHDIRH